MHILCKFKHCCKVFFFFVKIFSHISAWCKCDAFIALKKTLQIKALNSDPIYYNSKLCLV